MKRSKRFKQSMNQIKRNQAIGQWKNLQTAHGAGQLPNPSDGMISIGEQKPVRRNVIREQWERFGDQWDGRNPAALALDGKNVDFADIAGDPLGIEQTEEFKSQMAAFKEHFRPPTPEEAIAGAANLPYSLAIKLYRRHLFDYKLRENAGTGNSVQDALNWIKYLTSEWDEKVAGWLKEIMAAHPAIYSPWHNPTGAAFQHKLTLVRDDEPGYRMGSIEGYRA